MALLVLSTRWLFVHRYGVDMPFLDEWDFGIRLPLLALLAATFALPFAVSNALWSFQNQIAFLMLFSLLLLVRAPSPRHGRVFLGGSAILAALALLMYLATPRPEELGALASPSARATLATLLAFLTWPAGVGILVWLPALLLPVAAFALRDRGSLEALRFAAGLYALSFLLAAGLSLNRAPLLELVYTNGRHATRYLDFLVPSLAGLCFALEATRGLAPRPAVALCRLLPAGLALTLAGYVGLFSLEQAAVWRALELHWQERTLEAIRLRDEPASPERRVRRLRLLDFHPDPARLVELLDHPVARPVLPPAFEPAG